MLKHVVTGIAICLLLSATAEAQYDPFPDLFRGKLARIKSAQDAMSKITDTNQRNVFRSSVGAEAGELTPFLLSVLDDASYRYALSNLEEERIDKQLGAATNAAGSTSVVSKGSVPSLFAVAVENGALTRDISGTTVTFRASPFNVLKAISAHSYLAAGPAVPRWDGSFESVAKRASFYVSFDTSRGEKDDETETPGANSLVLTGKRQQLAAWGGRVELVNKRDPRRPEYREAWLTLMESEGKIYINALNTLINTLRTSKSPIAIEFFAWNSSLITDATMMADQDLTPLLRKALADFRSLIESLQVEQPQLAIQLRQAADAARQFATRRSDLINGLMSSWTAAVEYNFTAQSNTSGTATNALGEELPLPDLGNMNFVASRGFTDGPELTLNAGWTWFQNVPTGLSKGTRDLRASIDLSYGLPEIQNVGKLTLSLSGQVIKLKKEPLGQPVSLLNQSITRTGNIWLGQFKVTLPAKGAGMKIPIAFTYSNRTELVPDRKEWRVNLGLLFDMDKLTARP